MLLLLRLLLVMLMVLVMRLLMCQLLLLLLRRLLLLLHLSCPSNRHSRKGNRRVYFLVLLLLLAAINPGMPGPDDRHGGKAIYQILQPLVGLLVPFHFRFQGASTRFRVAGHPTIIPVDPDRLARMGAPVSNNYLVVQRNLLCFRISHRIPHQRISMWNKTPVRQP